MFDFNLDSYYFDWEIFGYVLIIAGLCLSFLSVTRFRSHITLIPKFPKSFFALGVVSFLLGIGITVTRPAVAPPPPPTPHVYYPELTSFDDEVKRWEACEATSDCMVLDECREVHAFNKIHEQLYRDALNKKLKYLMQGCLKGDPDSRKAVYSTECSNKKCKVITVKPSTMNEVEDRLNGKFDP